MEESDYLKFIGGYIYNSAKCDEFITMLIATKEYTVETINNSGINFSKKIDIFKKMLNTKYRKLKDEKYDIINELHNIRQIRNNLAHGIIHFDETSIGIRTTGEIHESGSWGQNLKISYSVDKIPEMNAKLDRALQFLMELWSTYHDIKMAKKRH